MDTIHIVLGIVGLLIWLGLAILVRVVAGHADNVIEHRAEQDKRVESLTPGEMWENEQLWLTLVEASAKWQAAHGSSEK